MSGLYIHIPFCAQRCLYCDFHSGTDLLLQQRYVESLLKELRQRVKEVQPPIETLYLGGGTPSLLNEILLHKLFDGIDEMVNLSHLAEVTMECNPDDLNDNYVQMLRSLPINRLSMGVQSFNDSELKFLNRRHDAQTAIQAIERCRKYGFDNLSIDLMYALPQQTKEGWRQSLHQAVAMEVEHISAYSLMYEEGSALSSKVERGLITPLSDEESVVLFDQMMDELAAAGYEQYEISNFAKPGYRSQHNSSYWRGVPYLGLGASAHSFDGQNRRWNLSHTLRYCDGVEQGEGYSDMEVLTESERFNEIIFTGLRTKEGVSLVLLKEHFPDEWVNSMLKEAQNAISNGLLELIDNSLQLTRAGIYVSDGLMSSLMRV